jgi:hypothetical protein
MIMTRTAPLDNNESCRVSFYLVLNDVGRLIEETSLPLIIADGRGSNLFIKLFPRASALIRGEEVVCAYGGKLSYIAVRARNASTKIPRMMR